MFQARSRRGTRASRPLSRGPHGEPWWSLALRGFALRHRHGEIRMYCDDCRGTQRICVDGDLLQGADYLSSEDRIELLLLTSGVPCVLRIAAPQAIVSTPHWVKIVCASHTYWLIPRRARAVLTPARTLRSEWRQPAITAAAMAYQ